MRKAVVVGSGAGGATAAMVLAEAGWHVVIFEKGPNHFSNLAGPGPVKTVFSNDELKMLIRNFASPDPLVFPRTWRPSAGQPVQYVGQVDELPQIVGGGTVHWDAKTPRFWDIDFAQLSALGPVPGADVADWPFGYHELARHYDEVERLIGVQGDLRTLPALVRTHAPRSGHFPMPPGPQQRSSLVAAEGAHAIGLHPFPFPMAINSQEFDGNPACNDCGFCSGYGCPIIARAGALAPLRRALRTGRAELVPDTMVTSVQHAGRRARGVSWVRMGRAGPVTGSERADVVVLAASAIETVRLALLSGLPDASGRLGTRLMLHSFMDGSGIFLDERLHAHRGRSTTQCAEDFADPDFPGARAFAKAHGLPYIRGGILELGGSQNPITEGQVYQFLLGVLRPAKPFGTEFKQLMRSSLLRDRLAGVNMIAGDLPYLTNTVTLDTAVKDVFGLPVARVTWSPGAYEQLAQQFYGPKITAMLKAAGAGAAIAIPDTFITGGVPNGQHIMGGMMMGTNPATSVCDPYGRLHGLDNVYGADGSVFVTSGAQNPTNTIMAVALRSMRHLAGHRAPPGVGTQPAEFGRATRNCATSPAR